MSDSDENDFAVEEWRSARRMTGPCIAMISFLCAWAVAVAAWGWALLSLLALIMIVDFYRFVERKENEKIYEDLDQ